MSSRTERPVVNAWSYCIIAAAIQARQKLPYLNSRTEIRQSLELMRLGRMVVARLERAGAKLPPIDLRPLADHNASKSAVL